MTNVGNSIGMMAYYNSAIPYYRHQAQSAGSQQAQQHVQAQQQAAAAAAAGVTEAGGQQYYYGYSQAPHAHAAHHQAGGAAQQYLDHAADHTVLGWPPYSHAPHHYSHHLQYQHHQQITAYQQHQQQQVAAAAAAQQMITGVAEWSGDEANNGVGAGEPSPPITISGSEVSSPGTPATPPANNNNSNTANNNPSTTPVRAAQTRSVFPWMKKPSYQSQPNPACSVAATATSSVSALHELCTLDALGKTRTKDKYRVVYTDHQRLELEKEFIYSRYITIRRKTELAANLALSERQVKIWFQNRRAKERKQVKKRGELEQKDLKPTMMDDHPPPGCGGPPPVPPGGGGPPPPGCGGMASFAALGGMGGMLGGLIHGGGSPPLRSSPHVLTLGHPPTSLHTHAHHPHAHPPSVLGL